MTEVATTTSAHPTRRGLAQWVIAFLLGVIAVGVWQRTAPLPVSALAQGQPMAGARGVYAFTGPLARDQFGLFMLDIDQGTLWCYAFDDVAGTRKLRLIAARTWMYDRYLQDFNCAAPDFRMVQQLVNQQRAQPGGAALDPAEDPSESRPSAP
ncbi:MAG: hypothetical protein IPM18_12655 [Phycisphaerales bacterium]|nr:hypothetical protein [Phycisphaerales bacterium]